MEVSSFDLHVLSTPPAFVLSQDQTLQDILELFASSFSFVVVDLHRRNFWFGSINGTRTLAMFISYEMITFTLFSFQRSVVVVRCCRPATFKSITAFVFRVKLFFTFFISSFSITQRPLSGCFRFRIATTWLL